jgi:integrase
LPEASHFCLRDRLRAPPASLASPNGKRLRRRQSPQAQAAADDSAGAGSAIAAQLPTKTAASGLRRGEVLGLRWRNVHLADPAGPTLRVCETVVRGRADTPKSAASERTIAIGPKLSEELFEHRGRTAYGGDDEPVFCHPKKGSVLDHKRYAETFREALARAEITDRVRPFHDGRHSAITHEAATEAHPLRSRLERATRTSRPHSATSTSPG